LNSKSNQKLKKNLINAQVPNYKYAIESATKKEKFV
jgi:hypothetical protein